jgi:hypothetical protein
LATLLVWQATDNCMKAAEVPVVAS